MNKPKAQGTSWETEFVRGAQDAGLMADRLAEGGSFDPGDVWIGDTPRRNEPTMDIPIVAWKRLVDNGNTRRVPDGARSVVVMSTEDFYRLAFLGARQGYAFVAELKASERLNVTRELDKAKRKLALWKARA